MENHDALIDQEIQEATEPEPMTLGEIFIQVFLSPYKGAYELFINKHTNGMLFGILFMIVFALVSAAMPYLMAHGEVPADSLNISVKIGIGAIIFQCILALFVFIVNAVAGRIDGPKAMFTGGLTGLILSLACMVIYLLSLIYGHSTTSLYMAFLMGRGPDGLNWILLFLIIYTFMLIFNVVVQSLRAGNEKDGASFYLSPILFIFACYVTLKIAKEVIK